MILRFPAELVQLLAQVKDSAAEKALPIWAQSEEMSCTANNARPILTDSRKLAKFALNQGKYMFILICLRLLKQFTVNMPGFR